MLYYAVRIKIKYQMKFRYLKVAKNTALIDYTALICIQNWFNQMYQADLQTGQSFR